MVNRIPESESLKMVRVEELPVGTIFRHLRLEYKKEKPDKCGRNVTRTADGKRVKLAENLEIIIDK